ncbi:PAS domain S-box protein [Alicyclobacillaceae bacterium I2511]|nr:PAS domain S-box protein [Alicyclobacillaceae bacterium I2511]
MFKEELEILDATLNEQTDSYGKVREAIHQLWDINFALDQSLIVAITDVRGNITFANQLFCDISQYSLAELLGQNHRIVNSGYHSHEFFRQLWQTIGQGGVWRGELKNRAKDGSFYWMDTVIVPSLNEQGKPCQYISFRKDITQRKMLEEQLDGLITTMPDLVLFKDGEGRWIKANQSALLFFGLRGVSYHGKTSEQLAAVSLKHGSVLRRFAAMDEEVWRRGKVLHREEEFVLEGGSSRVFELTQVPILHEDGTRGGLTITARDITERKQTDEFLFRAERVSAVGQVASRIAHEIRNPLAAMKWTLHLLKLDHPQGAVQFDALLTELDRVDGIVGELLVLGKPQEAQFKTVNLEEILRVVVLLMNSQARHSQVSLDLDCEAELPPLWGEPNQIKQVLMNLIKNGIEAMPQGGKVTIQAFLSPEHELVIRVSDEGPGVSEEVLQHMGEPFFTTKEKGTGLGLSVCHKIIHDHQGRLKIYAHPHEGTTVDVVMPIGSASEVG